MKQNFRPVKVLFWVISVASSHWPLYPLSSGLFLFTFPLLDNSYNQRDSSSRQLQRITTGYSSLTLLTAKMCIKTTYHYKCGHTNSFTPYCERAFDDCPYRITARRCSNPTLAEKTVRGICDAIECKYEEWDRRWICHKCGMDNENSMTCEGNSCEHDFCHGCDPCKYLQFLRKKTTSSNCL
ncbi:hypothetical protein BDP55DRAFT_665578 [Colletotrichum godetiae]|uniref:Uncharacterized protein n=1 Tax=Colletotrichum godetiae TaxID=1209918 RepID=A0AAJ0AKN9_9PEZI|nr:uncharacterized protein BDP55DRAFT_665578 [Colletotrichum godetiae]KAK1675005.1 hypothetical protein BDP55DRAFT_665578 [Colletotrichum godetiae]